MTEPEVLRVLPNQSDRMCWARGLDNGLRRRWAPPRGEIGLLEPSEGNVVADLGAGPGFFEQELLRRIGAAGRLYLVDIDAENLAIVRERLGGDPRVTILVGSAASVPEIPSGSVDRVLLSLVLCCLVDKSGALSEAWRILRPGGRLLATYPKIGRRWRWRRRSLGVTRPMWTTLLAQHPWTEFPVRSGWLVERHLLGKPDPSETSEQRAGDT